MHDKFDLIQLPDHGGAPIETGREQATIIAAGQGVQGDIALSDGVATRPSTSTAAAPSPWAATAMVATSACGTRSAKKPSISTAVMPPRRGR